MKILWGLTLNFKLFPCFYTFLYRAQVNYHVVEKYAKFFKDKQDLPQHPFRFFFLNKNITPPEMNYNLSNSHGAIFTPVLIYRKNLPDQGEDLGLHVLALTNYPLFHTGSHGTIIFRWKANGTIDSETYDYNMQEIKSPKGKTLPLKITTYSILLNQGHIDESLIKILSNKQYNCLGIKVYNDFSPLYNQLESLGMSKLEALYLEKEAKSQTITSEFLQEILRKLPNLRLFSINKEKLETGYSPSCIERRFLGIS